MDKLPNDFGRKKLHRLTISVHGLKKCRDVLNELSKLDEGTLLYESVLSFAVILYARPYLCNEKKEKSKSAPSVDKDEIVNDLNGDQLSLHKKLIKLRNKAIAHAEWGTHPTRIDKDCIITTKPFSITQEMPKERIAEFASLIETIMPLYEVQRASWWSYVQMNEI